MEEQFSGRRKILLLSVQGLTVLCVSYTTRIQWRNIEQVWVVNIFKRRIV